MMKKKFWIGILAAFLLLTLWPGMTPEAAADDAQSLGTLYVVCSGCRKMLHLEILEYVQAKDIGYQEVGTHWIRAKCPDCGKIDDYTSDSPIFQHSGGTETPTCTTGKTCGKCGAEYGKLGHDWTAWTSNGDNTHSRTCQREGCAAAETGSCGSSTAHCGEEGKCDVCGGTYLHTTHTFPAKWDRHSDSDIGRDADSHWVRCLYCTEGKAYYGEHRFVQGTDDSCLKSEATCVSPAVYYENCSTCIYRGTETYEHPWAGTNPNNHTGNEEIRGAVEATCTTEGYTGDTYCKDCDALLTSGTVIPATGHTGGTEVRGAKDATCTTEGYTGDTYCKDCDALLSSGTAIPATGEHSGGTPTCLRRAKCEVCGERYGDIDRSNHVDGCTPEWIITETEHTQKYSRCGKLLTETGEHTFGDWTVTQEPTESEEGEQERVCEICDYTETEAIPVAEAEAIPSPAPAATPEPTAEPAAEPAEPASTGSAWWIIALIVIAGVGGGIAVRQKKKK